MSLILDAINRADQERNSSAPSAHLQPSQSPEPKPSLPLLRWGLEILLLAIVAAAGGGFWLYSDKLPTSSTASPEPAHHQHASTQFAPLATAAKTTTKPSSAPPQATAGERSAANIKKITQPPTATSTNNRAVADLYQADAPSHTNVGVTDTNKSHNAIKNTPPLALPVTPQTAVSPQAPAASSTPFITELTWHLQQQIPSIDYHQHHYSPFPGESFVEINGLLLKPGENVGNGLRLLGISEKHATLSFNGTKFRLWAQNSWVNFN